jgi:hypothetical protein
MTFSACAHRRCISMRVSLPCLREGCNPCSLDHRRSKLQQTKSNNSTHVQEDMTYSPDLKERYFSALDFAVLSARAIVCKVPFLITQASCTKATWTVKRDMLH